MDATNNISISLLSDEEIPECARLLSKSFGHDAPFVDIYFPSHDTTSGQASLAKRLLAWKRTVPESAFLKATFESKGQAFIVGFGIWTLMHTPPCAELDKVEDVGNVWPKEDDREFMSRLWSKYVIPRTQTVQESAGKGVYGKCRHWII
jgi:hypothetical protein